METPWLLQFGATLRRDFFIKIRDGSQTFQEIFLPVYIIILLVLVKLIQPETNIPATPWQPKVDALCQPVVSGSQSVCQYLNRRMPNETVLAYVPQGNDLVDEFIGQVAHLFQEEYEIPVIVSRSFGTEEDLVNYYKVNPERIYAAIILEGMHGTLEFPEDLKYYIRINGSYVPSAHDQNGRNDECHQWSQKCSANDYLDSGFLALQSVISQVARKMSLPKSPCSESTYSKSAFAQQQPLPPYHQSFASKTFQLFTAMYMVWALVPQLQTVLYHLVKEKTDLVKDCMLVMGLCESVYWICWLLTYAAMSVFTSLILVLSAKFARLFAVSDTKVIFLLVYIYSLSLITMAFALSTMFIKVRRALSVSGALLIVGSLIIIPVELLQWSTVACALLSAFSPIGFAVAMNVISLETDSGDGGSHLSVGMIICILAIDSIVYILIAWYLDNTWPHPQRGSKRPWNFIFLKNFWFNHKEKSYHSVYDQGAHVLRQQPDGQRFEMNAAIEITEEVEYNGGVKDENSNMEQVDPDMTSTVAVELQNLRRVYTTRKWWEFWSFDNMIGYRTKRVHEEVEAVKGVSLKFYEGECFAIAGHGGSGKSDILYMLSRLSSCTSGEAYIYGFPLSTGGVELKSIVSVCPKENICTDLLTAREQLEYFGTIKAIPWHLRIEEGRERKTLKVQIDELLTELNLIEEADKQARELSPPARRKLSLALALIGDPRVVLIDQPTVGLDLESRNQFWNLIHKLQKKFLLIFTTDSMEEADVMADRKAILSHGVVKCCGSSLFLRKRFGLSYLLHIIRGEKYKSESMLRLIQSHIADAVPVQTPSGQAHSTFRFPLGSSSQMASLLMEIMANSVELGVDGGDLEATTLEEIFMKFQDEGEDEAASLEHVSNEKSFEDIDGESESLLGDATSRAVIHKGNVLKMQIQGLLSTRFCLYRLLDKAVGRATLLIEDQKKEWKKYGCTILSDGWTDGRSRTIINFLVACKDDVVFWKSVDASNKVKNAATLALMLENVVMEVGIENVVQIITDNAAAYVATGRILQERHPTLFWSPCAAHVLDLLLEDIGKLDWVSPVVEDARRVTKYIYNHPWVLSLMRKATKGKDLMRPAMTRFATVFLTLQSILDHILALKQMFVCADWVASPYSKKPEGEAVARIVFDDSFFAKAKEIVEMSLPLVLVLRICDGQQSPMGGLYEAMDRAKEAVRSYYHRDSLRFDPIWEIIDRRWNNMLHQPIHAAGYFLNPKFRRNIGATLTTVGLPAVLTLIALIMQLSIGKSGPQALDLFDTKIGNNIALFYTTHNESATSDAKILLDRLGTNHVLLDESSLYQRFDFSGLVHQKRMNAIGISFDELDIQDCSFKYTVMYQPWHTHQLPTVAAMLDNAFLQIVQAKFSQKPVTNLHCSTHPLPYDEGDDGVSLMVIFAVATGLLLIPPILGAQVVLDKQLGLFGLFHMSGMMTLAYWVAAFFTDILLLYIASFLAVVVGVFFGYSPFIKEAIPIITLLLVVSLPAQLLLSYVLSFMFGSAQGALSASSVICLLGAIIPYFILFVAPGGQLSSLGWHTLLSIFDPAYNLISSLHMVFSSVREIKGQNGFLPSSAPTILYFFKWTNFILLSVIGSLISILLLLLCLWRLESRMLNPESRDIDSHGSGESSEVAEGEQEAEDIEHEKEKVQSTIAAWENLHTLHGAGQHGGDQILCCGMSKRFGTSSGICSCGSNEGTWALKNIWLAVQQGEIIVLVGGEKAGKSTLLNCLGRQCSITYGDAIVCGNSVRYNYWAQQNTIGFCPQHALVYPALTLREHLKLFASLKGLANHNIPVEAILNALNLTEEADKQLGHCKPSIHSKLAIATAMLGDPYTLLLDEPTCGLDTASKRKIWTYIAAQSSSHATLICTQSSEEAEALGKRVGIIVKGQLKCLAAPQELKRRYGSAYSLIVMGETNKMEAINNFVSALFPLSENETNHEGNSCSPVMGQRRQKRFQIQIRNLSELAMLLHELEMKRHTLGIQEYVVSQPTLQQVFHRIIHASEGNDHT